MMNIQAVVFDKDGTLLDFNAFWIAVSAAALEEMLVRLHREDIPLNELLASIGVYDGKADADALLCHGTYAQMGEAIYAVLREKGVTLSPEEVVSMTAEVYTQKAVLGEVKPTCRSLREVLEKLKSKGLRLLLVTTDNAEITQMCLEKLGVRELFDRVITDDGKTPTKPNPQCIREYSKESGIPVESMVMVGDTMTDVRFARNAGMRVIGVGASREVEKKADAFRPDVSHLWEALEGIGENAR